VNSNPDDAIIVALADERADLIARV